MAELRQRRAFVMQLHKRSAQEAAEIAELEALIEQGAAAPERAAYGSASTFEELPLSQYTKVGRHAA